MAATAPMNYVNVLTGIPSVYGYRDGELSQALFNNITGITFSQKENVLFVADRHPYGGMVRKIDLNNNMVSTYAGSPTNPYRDGVGTDAGFLSIQAISIALDGTIFVADMRYLRKITTNQNVTTLFSVHDNAEPTGDDYLWSSSTIRFAPAIAASRTKDIVYVSYMTETNPHLCVTFFAVNTSSTESTYNPKKLLTLSYNSKYNHLPNAMATNYHDDELFESYYGDTIMNITNKHYSPLFGTYDTFGYREGKGTNILFDAVAGFDIDQHGLFYVADEFNSVVRVVAPNVTSSILAGAHGQADVIAGDLQTARFNFPAHLTVRADGSEVFVASANGSFIQHIFYNPDSSNTNNNNNNANSFGSLSLVSRDVIIAVIVVVVVALLFVARQYHQYQREKMGREKLKNWIKADAGGEVIVRDSSGQLNNNNNNNNSKRQLIVPEQVDLVTVTSPIADEML